MRARRPNSPRTALRACVTPHAAGLAIGSEASWVCVPEDRDAEPVRSCGTFPPAL
jgi:hypothetical protein